MRIISGTHKSRRISPDKSFKARPTTDFAKENLFNVLNNTIDFEDLKVLDLFGGTGSISYEFASRGAEQVICIELNFKHCAFIKKTVNELGFTQINVLRADIFKYLKGCKKQFDLIFADPPFDLDTIDTIPVAILKQNILNRGIVNKKYREFLAKIKSNLESIENLRNCIAHNRSIRDDIRENYEHAKDGLKDSIDAFFERNMTKLYLIGKIPWEDVDGIGEVGIFETLDTELRGTKTFFTKPACARERIRTKIDFVSFSPPSSPSSPNTKKSPKSTLFSFCNATKSAIGKSK